MHYSQLFARTKKTPPADEVSINAKLLLQGGFIDKLMAGSFTLLPLGRRVQRKIEQIVREQMNATGAQEILMPLLHPKDIWNETGRWDTAKSVMYQFKKNDKEYALSFTHEEIVMDLIRKHTSSYKDFPIKIYHFSTKFRDEPRAKSGILRGREFIMKDLYSVHTSKEDMMKYYWEVSDAYIKAFKRMNLEVKIVEASGGVFTKEYTHEYQLLSETGEDTIFYCTTCDFAQNEEVAKFKQGDRCPKDNGEIKLAKSIEVGNIFPLGTMYAEKMGVMFADTDGSRKPVWFASYGIGVTRLIGAIAEVSNDKKGIIWPKPVSPFDAHLVGLNKNADNLYSKLTENGVDVLYDDRDVSAGEKFADADLIGIPARLVLSEKTGDKIEFKMRNEKESRLVTLEECINLLKQN